MVVAGRQERLTCQTREEEHGATAERHEEREEGRCRGFRPQRPMVCNPPPPRPPPSARLTRGGAGHCVRQRSKRRPARSPSTQSCPTLPPIPPPVPSPCRIVFVARCAWRGACRVRSVLFYSRGGGTSRGSSALRLHLRHALDAQLHQGHAGRRRMSRRHFHLGRHFPHLKAFLSLSLRVCLWWCVCRC